MSFSVVMLVLASSVSHATWNLLLKRSDRNEVFVMLMLCSSSVLLAPLGLFLGFSYPLTQAGILWVALTIVLHVLYFGLLARGYSNADLSVVYPIARGISPSIVPLAALVLLGERISWPAALGIVAVVVGIYVVQWNDSIRNVLRQPWTVIQNAGMRYALMVGLTTAVYTLVDKKGVSEVQPFFYMYLMTLGSALALAPYTLRQVGIAPIRREWNQHYRSIIIAGGLMFLAYGLILTALSLARVSYVAPAREIGIVIGVTLGIVFLKEPQGVSRLAGATTIVIGLALLVAFP